ncbi:MAG: TlpA family protein disulfide reductase [Gemmatimonadales bacterium]|nr:MAG: TlpA family protein disulfide reductase [Gemmatimonadales bacterium]
MQRFAETFAGSEEVVVFTINSKERSRETVKKWMEDRGYHFPVLWGDKFAESAGVTAFPTTWVVDREGRIAFIEIGSSGFFAQEFGWRVDAVLLDDGGGS